MKRISDYIKELENFKEKCGDLPMLMNPENSGPNYFASASLVVLGDFDDDEELGVSKGMPVCFVTGSESGEAVENPIEDAHQQQEQGKRYLLRFINREESWAAKCSDAAFTDLKKQWERELAEVEFKLQVLNSLFK